MIPAFSPTPFLRTSTRADAPKPASPKPVVSAPLSPSEESQVAVARGTPRGMPTLTSNSPDARRFEGLPNPFAAKRYKTPSGEYGYYDLFGGAYAASPQQAGRTGAHDPRFPKFYQPVSPNTAFSLMAGGKFREGVARYLAGKTQQAANAVNPVNGLLGLGRAAGNALGIIKGEDGLPLPVEERRRGVAAASLGALQTAQTGAMALPVLQALWSRNPAAIARAVAKTYGVTAGVDAPLETVQRALMQNPDTLSAQAMQNALTGRVMGEWAARTAATAGEGAKMLGKGTQVLRNAPQIAAVSSLLDRWLRVPGNPDNETALGQFLDRGEPAATLDYSKLQSPGGTGAIEDSAIGRKHVTGLEHRNLMNVAKDDTQPLLRRAGAVVYGGADMLLNPGDAVDRGDEMHRGRLALKNLNQPQAAAHGDWADHEMDVLYRNSFSGKLRPFAWPWEDKPGVWTREDMPDRYARDPRRWAVGDKGYEQAVQGEVSMKPPIWNSLFGPSQVDPGLSVARYRTPEQQRAYAAGQRAPAAVRLKRLR